MAKRARSSGESDEDEVSVDDEIPDEGEFPDEDGDPDGDEFPDDDEFPIEDEDQDEAEEEAESSGRRIPILAIVSLGLIALFGALIGWLWVSFDEADMAALEPPAVRVEIPPPPAAPLAALPEPVVADAAAEDAAPQPGEESGAAPSAATEDAAGAPDGAAPVQESTEVAALAPEPEPEAELAEPVLSEPPAAEAPAEAEPSALPETEPAAPEQDVAMAPAPDPELLAPSPNGPLPVIGPDGRQAWQVYGRDFADPEERPRIAILLGPLGLIESASYSAIQQLPANVTLAFAPYTRNLGEWIAQARAAGHEVILHIPMEPFDYPDSDPGPHTLLTSISADDNIQRLEWLLGRASGYIGVSNFMGDRFTTSAEHVRPVLGVLKSRGLMFLDAQATRNSVAARVALDLGVPRALNNRFIDSEASRIAIDARLFELERIATLVGTAVGIGFPYPVTIERVAAWAQGLAAKGLVLAPLSAVANRQDIQ